MGKNSVVISVKHFAVDTSRFDLLSGNATNGDFLITDVSIEARVTIRHDTADAHILSDEEYIKLVGAALLNGKMSLNKPVLFEHVDEQSA